MASWKRFLTALRYTASTERSKRVEPESLPPPPADLASRIYFGKGSLHRFDSPDGSYGVMYAGRDAHCAFIETLA